MAKKSPDLTWEEGEDRGLQKEIAQNSIGKNQSFELEREEKLLLQGKPAREEETPSRKRAGSTRVRLPSSRGHPYVRSSATPGEKKKSESHNAKKTPLRAEEEKGNTSMPVQSGLRPGHKKDPKKKKKKGERNSEHHAKKGRTFFLRKGGDRAFNLPKKSSPVAKEGKRDQIGREKRPTPGGRSEGRGQKKKKRIPLAQMWGKRKEKNPTNRGYSSQREVVSASPRKVPFRGLISRKTRERLRNLGGKEPREMLNTSVIERKEEGWQPILYQESGSGRKPRQKGKRYSSANADERKG